MTIKELKSIRSAIRHAKQLIQELACEDYPFTEFEDKDLSDMFYELNDMCVAFTAKIEAAEAAAND